MLRVFSLFTLLASANIFAIGDSNITLSDGVLVTDHFHWDLGDEWEIDLERDSGFNLNYDEKFSVYLKSGESTIQISLYVDDLSISDYSDNLARELDDLIPYSDDVLMHSEYFLTNDFIHSGVLERYKSDTNKYYSIIDATTTGFDGNSSSEWVNFSAIIEGDNLILADVVELIKRVDFLEDSLGHFSIPAVANLDNGESKVTYHIGETNLELTSQWLSNDALTLPLYNFDYYKYASWEELSIIDDQNQTTAILENRNGDILTFNDFGDVSMDEYLDALLEYERSQTNKTIEDYGLFLTDRYEIGFGIHLSEDQGGTTQHEYLFVIDAGQDEDANTWRYIEIRLFSSALSFHDAYEMIGRTEKNYVPSINSEQKKAVVNLLTSMVAPLDDLDSTKPKVLKFSTEEVIDTSNSDQISRVGIGSTIFAIPLIIDRQNISLRFINLNDALLSEQNALSLYDSNISNLSSFVTETGFNAYTFEVSHEPTFPSPAHVEHRSIVDLSSATLITGKETIDSAVIYHRYDQEYEEFKELTPYLKETLNSIAVTSFEENVDELQEEIGELPDITDISLLEVVEDGPISFSIPADLNVSNTISFKSDPLTSVLAEYRLNTGDVSSSPDIELSFRLLDMEDLDSYLNPLKFDSDYTTLDTFRTFITSNNYIGKFVNEIWLDRDLQASSLILIFDQQEIVEKLPDGTFLLGQVAVGNLDTNISSSTLLAIADSIKINPDKIPAFLDPLDQETGELPDTYFMSLPKEIEDGPVKFSVPADLGFSSYNSSSPFYIEPDQNGLLANYNLNKLSISLKYTQKDLKDEMFEILQGTMAEDYSILLNQSFTTSNNYNGHITELNSTSGSKSCIIAVDITIDEIISKMPKDSKLILTARSYGGFSNDILMAIVNSFQLDPSLSIQDLHPPLALNSKFTDGPITICLPDNWIVDPKKAYTERENLSHAQYGFYERSGLSTGVFLNIDSGSLANNLDDWGAQYLHSYQSSQLNRGSVASHYLSSHNQLFKGISVSRHYPTLLTNLNLLGLSSDFWIGMDITTSEWKTRHLRNQYAKDSDWLKAFIVAENSLHYNTALEIIKCLDFNHSNYQEIPPFKENNSTIGISNYDDATSPINDKIIENPQSNLSDSLRGYAPESIVGFSVISTGSDGTQYDPLVFSDHGISSRDYAVRDYQYEKTSSTQGKIIYPFSGGDDDKPEVTIVTFSSLNEGTYLWTEYSDSSLQNPVDTDQGSWKMIPGYERTADSQNSDLAPESIAGLLSEYISANDSSYEIIYFSKNGSATAHSNGRMYSYEKISDNQGIITYSFENEAVPKPEITNITFTSLNGGTFTWTEYSDSSLSSILDTDTGTWVMASGYARTAESSPSQTTGNVMSKWVESGWLGVFFEASNGWIYHPELGWMYAENSSADKTWLYSDKKGWLWTSKDSYPHLYSDNSSNWVYVASDQDAPTKAFDYNPKKWTLWQDLTLNRMVQPSPEKLSTSSADEKKVYEIINSTAPNKDKLNRIAEAIRSKL